MNNQEICELVKKYYERVDKTYPRFHNETERCFIIILDIISEDYESLNSSRKRLRQFRLYLSELIKTAYVEDGIKNYMKCVLDVLYDENVLRYLSQQIDKENNDVYDMLEGLKKAVTYWQGYEGVEYGKLNQLLSIVEEQNW